MSFGGTNLDQGQAYNRRLLLEAIRVHGSLSRADLTRLTGLAPQTVSNIASTLEAAGLVTSRRRSGSSRGQPPKDLQLNPGGGYAFGISVDKSRLFTVLLDITGVCLDEFEDQIDALSPSSILDKIESAVATIHRRTPVPKKRILGAGLAMTGLTLEGNLIGLSPSSASRQWQDFPIVRKLEIALSMPIFTDNDARAAAVAEAFHGQGRSYRNFLYVYFGVGIGGGIVSAGQPFRGSNGRAGEFGHIITEPGGKLCSCGGRGCLEQYTSITSALEAIGCDADENNAQNLLVEAYEARDVRLMNWIDVAASHLSTAVVILENIFDPQAVLLGGIIAEPVLDAIVQRMLPLPRTVSSQHTAESPRIVRSGTGPKVPAMGAASLALFDATSADLSLLLKRTASS